MYDSVYQIFLLLYANFPSISGKLSTAKSSFIRKDEGESETRLYILVATSFVFIIVVIAFGFILLRRRKIYGGFYLFSQPPDPDYLRDIDPARALIEQTNGLPYDPVWEFPRKRIKLRELQDFHPKFNSHIEVYL